MNVKIDDNKFFPRDSYKSSDGHELGVRKLYGSRVFADESTLETLCEFLNVVKGRKKFISHSSLAESDLYFPSLNCDDCTSLSYQVDYKLNLKLFSLYLGSNSSTLHESHKIQYEKLRDELKAKIEITDQSKEIGKEKTIDILENLFMGFQGVGVNRDWCAQSFLPVCQEFLTDETIWQATAIRKAESGATNSQIHELKDIRNSKQYFAKSSHNLYARSGEVLYLEILLALQQSNANIEKVTVEEFKGIKFTDDEKNVAYLKDKLSKGIKHLLNENNVKILGQVATFIDNLDDNLKFDNPQEKSESSNHYNKIGWIPKENWKLGYLFAVELTRILSNEYQIVEELGLIEKLIILQTIRRFNFISSSSLGIEKPLIAIIDIDCPYSDVKEISNATYSQCLLNIYNAEKNVVDDAVKLHYIDTRYGCGVFKKLSKEIGFVVPRTGDPVKFVLTNEMLNCLVASTISPNKKMTLESFLKQLKLRYGFIFDNEGLNEVNRRRGKQQIISRSNTMDWLLKMLDESGYLIQLSDYLSLVTNSSVSR